VFSTFSSVPLTEMAITNTGRKQRTMNTIIEAQLTDRTATGEVA
jgi:hypothetical protein